MDQHVHHDGTLEDTREVWHAACFSVIIVAVWDEGPSLIVFVTVFV